MSLSLSINLTWEIGLVHYGLLNRISLLEPISNDVIVNPSPSGKFGNCHFLSIEHYIPIK